MLEKDNSKSAKALREYVIKLNDKLDKETLNELAIQYKKYKLNVANASRNENQKNPISEIQEKISYWRKTVVR